MPDDADNASIRFGLAFEDAIAHVVQRKTGLTIADREREFTEDFNTCHVDGIFSDAALYEAKTTTILSFWEGWGEPGTDRVPQSYQIQAQNNMRLSRAPFTRLFVLCWPMRPEEWEAAGIGVGGDFSMIDTMDWATVLDQMGLLKEYRIEASERLQELLRDQLAHFWHTYVLPEREPPIDAYADIRRAFPAPKGTLVATEQEQRWAAEYKEIGEEISPRGRLGKRREELKVEILKSMRARDGAMDDESREKTVLRDATGKKLVSWDGKTFR